MLLLLFLAAQGASPDSFAERAWARFSRAPALAHSSETVEVATDGGRSGVLHYKLRLTRRRLGMGEEVLWTNSRTCPAVRGMLVAMEALALPRPDAPGIGSDELYLIADGVGYTLQAPSKDAGGRLMLTSNVGTPLAGWVEASLAALAPCWSAVKLRVAD